MLKRIQYAKPLYSTSAWVCMNRSIAYNLYHGSYNYCVSVGERLSSTQIIDQKPLYASSSERKLYWTCVIY